MYNKNLILAGTMETQNILLAYWHLQNKKIRLNFFFKTPEPEPPFLFCKKEFWRKYNLFQQNQSIIKNRKKGNTYKLIIFLFTFIINPKFTT